MRRLKVTEGPDSFNTGERKIFCLEETDSVASTNTFFTNHMVDIKNPKGWIFVSHRGVVRGVDINGVEPATMVINFRFAN